MSAKSNAPVIIKKKKRSGGHDGHHGGAWKVAYADFVTAMMAFFLLMWLLGATDETQRKGIADFFAPTISVNRQAGGGTGALGGDSVFTDDGMAQSGTGATHIYSTEAERSRGDSGVASEDERLSEIENALTQGGGESVVSDLQRRHIVTRLSDEGLIVELFARPGTPLFEAGTPTPLLEGLVGSVVEVFRLAANPVAVQGHTAARPVVALDRDRWTASQDQADSVRRLMVDAGFDPDRMARVSGFAERRLVAADPLSERNNRVEVILLRSRL